jgi:hypothetical protein
MARNRITIKLLSVDDISLINSTKEDCCDDDVKEKMTGIILHRNDYLCNPKNHCC